MRRGAARNQVWAPCPEQRLARDSSSASIRRRSRLRPTRRRSCWSSDPRARPVTTALPSKRQSACLPPAAVSANRCLEGDYCSSAKWNCQGTGSSAVADVVLNALIARRGGLSCFPEPTYVSPPWSAPSGSAITTLSLVDGKREYPRRRRRDRSLSSQAATWSRTTTPTARAGEAGSTCLRLATSRCMEPDGWRHIFAPARVAETATSWSLAFGPGSARAGLLLLDWLVRARIDDV